MTRYVEFDGLERDPERCPNCQGWGGSDQPWIPDFVPCDLCNPDDLRGPIKVEEPPEPVPEGACSRCGETKGVKLEDSCTAYAPEPLTLWTAVVHEDKPPDPNAPLLLCRECAEQHHHYWEGMWDEYYASRR